MAEQDATKDQLIAEYPVLKAGKLTVEKRFYSESSREYNTYLIRSDLPEYNRFVAKGVVLEKYSLANEWRALTRLSKLSFPCPRLLFPDHSPKNFMLLEYLEGEKASEKLLKKENTAKVFRQIGELTGRLHTIPAPWFGELTTDGNVDWANYSRQNMRERLNGAAKIIPLAMFEKARKLLESLEDLIVDEGKLPPILIHRDIYSDNFIVEKKSGQMFLIDYGMAIGGRPFYDLAKFYIFDLYRFPQLVRDFYAGYTRHIELPQDFRRRLEMYLLRELLGCINFFGSISKTDTLNLCIKLLGELVNREGKLTDMVASTI